MEVPQRLCHFPCRHQHFFSDQKILYDKNGIGVEKGIILKNTTNKIAIIPPKIQSFFFFSFLALFFIMS